MAADTTHKRRKADRPDEIIAASITEFAENGFAATKLTDVAKRAGVSKGTIYQYFKDKDALFRAAFNAGLVDTITEIGPTTFPPAMTPADILRHALKEAFVGLRASEAVSLVRIMVVEGTRFPDLVLACQTDLLTVVTGPLEALIDAGIADGSFAPGPYRALPAILLAPGVLLALIDRFLEPELGDAAIDAFLDLTMNGILTRP